MRKAKLKKGTIMRLVASAIKFFTIDNPDYPIIFTGKRHSDIFEKMFKMGIKYNKTTAVQGFITDDNKFVDRIEAKKIAVENNQLIVPIEDTYFQLFSEDIW